MMGRMALGDTFWKHVVLRLVSLTGSSKGAVR
jgi:hypothetical protein